MPPFTSGSDKWKMSLQHPLQRGRKETGEEEELPAVLVSFNDAGQNAIKPMTMMVQTQKKLALPSLKSGAWSQWWLQRRHGIAIIKRGAWSLWWLQRRHYRCRAATSCDWFSDDQMDFFCPTATIKQGWNMTRSRTSKWKTCAAGGSRAVKKIIKNNK